MRYLLLFDIDGTLVRMKGKRSRTIFKNAFAHVFEQNVPDELFGSFAGRTDRHILWDVAVQAGIDEHKIRTLTPEFFATLSLHFQAYSSVEHIELLPGVEEIVQHFHQRTDVLLFLLTGNIRECAYMKLAPYKVDAYFPDGAFGDISDNRSDLPPHALQKANALVGDSRFDTSNTLIIGDTPDDIQCARDNFLRVLSVGTGAYSAEELRACQPDDYIDSFADFAVSLQTIERLLD